MLQIIYLYKYTNRITAQAHAGQDALVIQYAFEVQQVIYRE